MTPIELAIAALLMVLAPTLIFRAIIAKSRTDKVTTREGLDLLVLMQQLLITLQQHRGMTSAFLSGKHNLKASIDQLHIKVGELNNKISECSQWVDHSQRWQDIATHWRLLHHTYTTLPLDQNIVQHNQLIAKLLYVIEDTAEHHNLRSLSCYNANLQCIWKDLLTAAEYIGQARALGTAVTAKGNCDCISRIRLNYLVLRINDSSQVALTKLRTPDEISENVRQLVELIKNDVMQPTPKIQSEQYFSRATACLDDVFGLFNSEINQLRSKAAF